MAGLKLNFTQRGSGAPVLLLHGLFGSGNNLGALARSLEARYSVYSLDLPNHGRSGWTVQTSLGEMSSSIAQWMQQQELSSAAVVGHSLGGKVALQLALEHPRCVAAVVAADIAPVAYPAHHDAVFAALDAVGAAGCKSRADAQAVMSDALYDDKDTIAFLLMSLQRGPDGSYGWRFNLEGIKQSYAALRAAPEPGTSYKGPVLFIKGGDSDYIQASHRAEILTLFPAAGVKVMPGCGHWLHAESPQLFNSLVARFLGEYYSH